MYLSTMDFVPADVSLFRSSMEALKEFLPIAQLRLSADGLRIGGMDSSHAGFVDYYLAAADCSKADIKKPLVIGIQMAVFTKVLASVGSGDTLALSISKKDHLVISTYNTKMAKKAVYEITMLDIDDTAMDLPSFAYAGDITMKTVDLFSVVKEMAHFGDILGLTLDEEGLHLATTGDSGQVKQLLENTEDREMSLTGDSVSASFGTKYIAMILKGGAPLAATMQLEFDPEKPLKASFRFGSGSYFVAYLAPRVMDD